MSANVSSPEDHPMPSPSEVVDRSPSSPANTPLLPPCRVCGEKASGFHYGANTCEACKGFFRRSLRRKQDYKCMASDGCRLFGMQKNNKCPKCRLQRCLAIGISKTAIKNGRYTLEKKTKYIMEVKALEQNEATENKTQPIDNAIVIESIGSPPLSDMDKPSPKPLDNDMLDRIIAHMTDVFNQNTDCTPEFLQRKEQTEKEYLEKLALENEIFGEMKPISTEEYLAVRKSTGLDIDGRRDLMEKLNDKVNLFVNQLINFAKSIPGFAELPMDDQTSLIKNSARYGCWFFMHYKKFNFELRLFHSFCGTLYDHNMMRKFHTEEHLDNMYHVLYQIKKLNLSDEELVMASAVALLLADQFPLHDPENVEKCLNTCLDCLNYLLKKNHPNEGCIFGRVIAVITEMRTIEHGERNTLKECEDTFDFEFHQLWHELCGPDASE